jgi:hypothetical protein
MQRYDIIKHLINFYNFQSYLEIGVLGRETLNQINVPLRHGVDPNGQGDFTMTSDEFFANHCKNNYDLIFIDGLHLREQVIRDIENSLTHLNDGGIIITHDMLPESEWHQFRTPWDGRPWTGDSWKAFADLRCTRKDLDMAVVDCDWGCGIIKRGSQELYLRTDLEWTWQDFVYNKKDIMNIITVEEFLGRTQ